MRNLATLILSTVAIACGSSERPTLKGEVTRYCHSQETSLAIARDGLKKNEPQWETLHGDLFTSPGLTVSLYRNFQLCAMIRDGASADLSGFESKFHLAASRLFERGGKDRAIAEASLSEMVELYGKINKYPVIR